MGGVINRKITAHDRMKIKLGNFTEDVGKRATVMRRQGNSDT